MESEKRQIEFKLLETRDQLEIEERAKRKLAIAKKIFNIRNGRIERIS